MFLDRPLRLMDGRPRAPVSLDPMAIRTTPENFLSYTSGMPDANGSYSAAGFKHGSTIDLIFDSAGFSGVSPESSEARTRAGIVPALDYKLQYYRALKGYAAQPEEMSRDVEFAEHWSVVSNIEVVGGASAASQADGYSVGAEEDWVAAVRREGFTPKIVLASDHVPVFLRTHGIGWRGV